MRVPQAMMWMLSSAHVALVIGASSYCVTYRPQAGLLTLSGRERGETIEKYKIGRVRIVVHVPFPLSLSAHSTFFWVLKHCHNFILCRFFFDILNAFIINPISIQLFRTV